jgi:hypothetical protein
MSTWILKSPVMRISWGVVVARDRKEENSDRKIENGLE